MKKRWSLDAPDKLLPIMKVVPIILMWALWKRRNGRRHVKDMSYESLVHQCLQLLYFVIRVKYPWIQIPRDRIGLINTFANYKPKLYHYPIKWEFPNINWIKCNTNEANRGNLGSSPYAFCLRYYQGNIVYPEAKEIGFTNNMKAKTMGVKCCLRYYMAKKLHNIVVETNSLGL